MQAFFTTHYDFLSQFQAIECFNRDSWGNEVSQSPMIDTIIYQVK